MKKKWITFLMTAIVTASVVTGCKKEEKEQTSEPTPTTQLQVTPPAESTTQPQPSATKAPVEKADVRYKRVSVHDPSVIKVEDTYYIFGSHMAWAKSKDLMQWEIFQTNINSKYKDIFQEPWESYAKTASNPEVKGNLWAPDVIYNEAMKKYCMYMSVNGDDWNSVIVLLTADNIEGPYEYVGPVVYSGFNTENHPAEKTDIYKVLGEGANLTRYQSTRNTKLNAIDPCVLYDDEGTLWMTFGSWFGGIYMLKLDANTGLRDYTTTYTTVPNESDQYYGYKLAGGFEVSGEGPYILKVGDYYYLFLSYGGLTASGGYQMRVFRSEKITGPYVDQTGNSAIYKNNVNNLFSEIGIRIMCSYKFSANIETHVAQGHNSVFVDDDGKIFLIYHTRFAGGKNGIEEAHEVRVQQLFVNQDGWLIAAPYEYSGETLEKEGYEEEQLLGEYELVVHNPKAYYQKTGTKQIGIIKTQNITLNQDKTVSGDVTGTWSYTENTSEMTITINGVEYKGYFLKQATEGVHKIVMTFTALGNNVCVWGSKK